jgi:hypothetical protein
VHRNMKCTAHYMDMEARRYVDRMADVPSTKEAPAPDVENN